MPELSWVRGQPEVVLVRSKTSRRNGTRPTHEECARVVIDWRSPPGTGHVLYLVRRTTGGACHTLSASGSARPSCYYRAITDEMTLRPRQRLTCRHESP